MAPLFDDDFVWNRAVHSSRISFLPRKCYISGESLWLKKAWRCRFYDWSGEEDEWYSERAYLWKKLKVG